MIVFPNCKINLGLHILGKRTDGYHDLETVFYPIPFYDVLEIIQHTQASASCTLFLSGLQVDGQPEDNLCVKAYHLLKKDFPQLPAVSIYLHKVIPAGAGLGGGSADGAFMLLLLNKKFNLEIPREKLLSYALTLGSDCPFFIINQPCFAQQRGEILTPLALDLSGYKLVLVNPGIHINTGWAFTQAASSPGNDLENNIHLPVGKWKDHLTNDFEDPVFKKYAEIQSIKDHLYASGARYASMSGTGSTVYGIFEKDASPGYLALSQHFFIKEMPL